MDACLVFIQLLTVLSLTGEATGAVKSTSFGSLKNEKIKQYLCTTCKVTQKVGNHTVHSGSNRKVLKCAFSGIPYKNITWFKNGKTIYENRHSIKRFNPNGSKLRIKNIIDTDTGWYRCVGHNGQGLIITTKGYLTVIHKKGSRQSCADKTQSCLDDNNQVKVTGKCELYKGKTCSSYISYSTLVFVNVQERENEQYFIEKRVSVANTGMISNLSNSCKPFVLPLLCHYHFPECSTINSKAEPKMICKSECEQIMTKHCKAEYILAQGLGKSGDSKDDMFPNCNTLPKNTKKGMCFSLRHIIPPINPVPTSKSGHCVVYRGDLCKNKKGKKVFIPMDTNQDKIEENTRKHIEHSGRPTRKCQPYVRPLLCELNFPYCDESSSPPKGKPICKDECFALKDKYCKKEYMSTDSALSFDCSSLQAHSRTSGKCSVIGVHEATSEFSTTMRPPIGICTPYVGTICKEFIDIKRMIFIQYDTAQGSIEKKIETAIKSINSSPKVSEVCRPFVLPVMCHHLFPYCDSYSTQPRPSYICRPDCLHIQHKVCPVEYEIAENQELTGNILFPRCSALSKATKGCISLRQLHEPLRTVFIPGDCFVGKGGGYRGFVNTTESGLTCQRWSVGHPHPHMLTGAEYPELHGGHNFCRNPGGKREKPWCFTTDPKRSFEMCNIPKCVNAPFNGTGENYLGTVNRSTSGKPCEPWNKHEPKHNWAHNYCRNPSGRNKRAPWCYVGKNDRELCPIPRVSTTSFLGKKRHLKNLLFTIIPCVVFGLVVGVIIIAVCWKRHKQGPDFIKKNTPLAIPVFLPELKTIPADNIVLSKFIGNGRFGALYHGEIHSSEDGGPGEERITRFVKKALKEFREDFITQAKKWSQFHHPNIFTIEAISSGEDPVSLVFEYSAHGCLYQYLIHHSPNNPNITRDHALLSKANLLDISRQIAAGMSYISSHRYVHGDLMTRNCQVSHSMVIKITDFSIDRDTCYYRRPNKRPTPLGWMAPETIDTEVFTTQSDVWAFGVVLWEIFTYGFQPYYGYTFPEVRKMVLSGKLLERPRDCFAFIYELMEKCWNKDPTQRPQFFDLHEDMNIFVQEVLEEHDLSDHHDDDIHTHVVSSSC